MREYDVQYMRKPDSRLSDNLRLLKIGLEIR
jgi:hypothetical protein